MVICYAYRGRLRDGKITIGHVFSDSRVRAQSMLSNLGLRDPILTVNFRRTFDELLPGAFDPIQLRLAYDTVADLIDNGDQANDAFLMTVDCVDDFRLQAALVATASRLSGGGERISTAMRASGFAPEDCSVVAMSEQLSRETMVLRLLAQEKQREGAIHQAVTSAMRTPKFIGIASVCITYAMIWAFAPVQAQFGKSMMLGRRMPESVTNYLTAVNWVESNFIVFSLLYWGFFGALIAVLVSPWTKRLFLKHGPLSSLMEYSDLALQWKLYSAYFVAGDPVNAPATLAQHARHPRVREAFKRLDVHSKHYQLTEASERSGFPRIVTQFLANGERTSAMETALKRLVDRLYEIVGARLERSKAIIANYSTIVGGLLILLLFALIWGPMGLIMKTLLSGR